MNTDFGDVAFIKHTTLSENNADASKYEYLCKDGSRKGKKKPPKTRLYMCLVNKNHGHFRWFVVQ